MYVHLYSIYAMIYVWVDVFHLVSHSCICSFTTHSVGLCVLSLFSHVVVALYVPISFQKWFRRVFVFVHKVLELV